MIKDTNQPPEEERHRVRSPIQVPSAPSAWLCGMWEHLRAPSVEAPRKGPKSPHVLFPPTQSLPCRECARPLNIHKSSQPEVSIVQSSPSKRRSCLSQGVRTLSGGSAVPWAARNSHLELDDCLNLKGSFLTG